MNSFQTMESGKGLLKQSYDPDSSPMTDALKKKRANLSKKIWVDTKTEQELGKKGEESDGDQSS